MKRILSSFLCFLICLSSFTLVTNASTEEVVGEDVVAPQLGDAVVNTIVEEACFNATVYKRFNDDISHFSYRQLKEHWIGSGIKEGRRASIILDLKYYAANNDDLVAVYGNDYYSLYYHFLTFGYKEHRKSSLLFDGQYYCDHHPDVAAVYKDEYIIHYIQYGIDEGRRGSETFDINFYCECYSDVAETWPGLNCEITEHYASYGIKEGRLGYCDPQVVKELFKRESGSYTFDSNKVYGIRPNTTVEQILGGFYNSNATVYSSKGKKLSATDVVGTDSQIRLYNDDELVKAYSIVMLGDLDDNGIVDSTDYLYVKSAFIESVSLSDAQFVAADIDCSNKVDSTDYIRLKSHFLGKITLFEEEPAPPAEPAKKTYNILFIGNSFTFFNSMPQTSFAEICQRAGYNVSIDTVLVGGYTLYNFANRSNSYGAQVYNLLTSGKKYDYVILQEQSSLPITSPSSFYSGARSLASLIRANGAQICFYQTWGYKAGHSSLYSLGGSTAAMEAKLRAAYESIARELGADIAYVGKAMLSVYQNYDFDKDLYNADYYHPSEYGSLVAAWTLFSAIFDRNPYDVSFNSKISPDYAKIIRSAAAAAQGY